MEPAAATNNSAVATNGATQAEWHERVMHKCRESVEVKQKFFERYADDIAIFWFSMAISSA